MTSDLFTTVTITVPSLVVRKAQARAEDERTTVQRVLAETLGTYAHANEHRRHSARKARV